ncbi:Uncharacterized protein BM_BM17119 [Brugia malayi]|uniref:DNA_MISMATCH_REPAIR_2 domain-containing protein n=1 Tax=Brugia malayi TaxID=6279 RepID=A0A4E9FRX4_BRUMA|nr:Uncharacterized protein BM_BM17119 [Brugia malayi]VIO99958.1 Uncharacterized protein BM_BM17119 [Brugia malayi]
MAEKSTFLRQNALIAILAHMDSFVPADSAHIGVNDKIFSRVGATDNITAGYSTFMVEMIETATIVNQATDRSLVILDEIGRGTGVYNGLSIAQAVIEHIHNVNKCRAISATHYTKVSKYLKSVKCFCVRIKEWKEEVIFLHEVVEGVADESYGTHVAKLAASAVAEVERMSILLSQVKHETLLTMQVLNEHKPHSNAPLHHSWIKPTDTYRKMPRHPHPHKPSCNSPLNI